MTNKALVMRGMMGVLIFNILFLVVISHAENSKEWSKANFDTLQHVQLIMRHGDRNPISSYPLDPHKDDPDFFPGGYGQLTNRGVKQTKELGKFVRQRYDGFLGRKYDWEEVYAVSSDTDRSIRSGNSFLRGLFPKRYEEDNNKESSGSSIVHSHDNCPDEDDGEKSQVVPLRTIEREIDNYLYLSHKCPRYDEEFKSLIMSEGMTVLHKGMDKLGAVMKNTGIKDHGLATTGHVFDYLNVLKAQNKPLPDWVTPEIMQFGREMFQFVFELETRTPTLKKLRSALVKKVSQNIEKKLNDPKEEGRRFILYSSHDRTIVSFLNILGMFNALIPNYAAGLLVELHKDPEQAEHHLEFYYRNDTSVEPYQLSMTTCGSPCLVSNFQEIVKNLVPEDFDIACQL